MTDKEFKNLKVGDKVHYKFINGEVKNYVISRPVDGSGYVHIRSAEYYNISKEAIKAMANTKHAQLGWYGEKPKLIENVDYGL